MKIAILLVCLVGYVNSLDCSKCYPGTSESICPHRKSTDPILCCNDGRKYTPCIYNCARICNKSLRLVGCGAECFPTYENFCPATTSTSTLPPQPTCKDKDHVGCQFPSKPYNSCEVPTMTEQCDRCVEESPATGRCAQVGYCYYNSGIGEDNICDIPFDPSECDMNPGSEACTTCPYDSPAKGICI